ncbi:MAG: magnesium/cobalt transporter CorA [Promethearchaeota archaeon]
MKRLIKRKRTHKAGLPPGTLIYTGEKKEVETKITIIDYNDKDYKINELSDLYFNFNEIEKNVVRWIKVIGLTNEKVIEYIGKTFKLHPLVLEDILNPNQRPKFEYYGDYIFIVMRRIFFEGEERTFENEQISFVLGTNYVISFQEHDTEVFVSILERIKSGTGRIRFMGADYLDYTLIDVLIDNYFIILEEIGEKIEEIEDILIYEPQPETLQKIYDLKRKNIELRKSIWPTREVISKLQREESKLISADLQIYLRDIYDHIFRITDLLDNYRDIVFGMLDIYLSSISNKMNDIMKVLTIISTIFIPLSFLAGFYGMNFIYMPELSNPFAYPILIIVMISIGILMILFFKKKKWI